MALSLTAEQKDLLSIFKIEKQYVVPAYQRPYSWEYDQCFQLYTDLMAAFKSKEDYFIGNIIIAKSESNKGILEIIDGQQRLITLILLIKVLYIFSPNLKVLYQILEKENWEGNETISRIISEIFEANDGFELNEVLQYDKNFFEKRFSECIKNEKVIEKNCKNRFETNILFFYNWLLYYKNNNGKIEDFVKFLLVRVYLLPIELTGKTQDEANEKALVIFETINNRGKNLEDADIFKAKLYKKAKNINEENIFIKLWIDFKINCENLNLEIDDIFRFYTHIIRGQEEITSSEINLRTFFTLEKYSPFELKKYKEILDDLFKIVEILEFINREKNKETELAKWLQLVDIYTNQYPKFAVVTYLYINHLDSEELEKNFILFLKSLIRFIYYKGATTSIKFEIYNIIRQICNRQNIDNYYVEIEYDFFNSMGRLKYGFALLAFYSDRKDALINYNIDKIITVKDKNSLNYEWGNLENIYDRLGNFIVLEISKHNVTFNKKLEYYKTSKLEEVKQLTTNEFCYQKFNERDTNLKEILIKFFKGEL